MTLYVLTVGDAYYPSPGAGDWRGVFTDLAAAWRAHDELDVGAYSWAYVIEVRPDGYRELSR